MIWADYTQASLALGQEAVKEPLWFALHKVLCELVVEWVVCQIGKALPVMIKMASDILYASLQRVPF